MRAMKVEEFDYELPSELIAQEPSASRGAGRLLHLDGSTGEFRDHVFADLIGLVRPGDLLVFNDTRVIKARLHGARESGGKVEALIERILSPRKALAMVRASHAPKGGQRIAFADASAVVVERRDDLFLLEFDRDVAPMLDRLGELPLPPYIGRQAGALDEERYQTVYARAPGAVAAPTAGLHFDEAMMARLSSAGIGLAYVTLHVGAGTFQPVRSDDIEAHVMHSERYEISEQTAQAIADTRAAGGRIAAVGTTSLRALESAAAGGALKAGSGETRLFIRPGYRFRIVDRLLTNFHLPRSTLLMLVSAFAGLEAVRAAYAHAVRQRYRFFSYGDAMLIECAPAARA
jgi:S-adenosylmethionine:tRNA ribosyltransferase-isomerase